MYLTDDIVQQIIHITKHIVPVHCYPLVKQIFKKKQVVIFETGTKRSCRIRAMYNKFLSRTHNKQLGTLRVLCYKKIKQNVNNNKGRLHLPRGPCGV